jgi:hypothetical protein
VVENSLLLVPVFFGVVLGRLIPVMFGVQMVGVS